MLLKSLSILSSFLIQLNCHLETLVEPHASVCVLLPPTSRGAVVGFFPGKREMIDLVLEKWLLCVWSFKVSLGLAHKLV